MGGACSGQKGTKVKDSITKVELNANAHQHLKELDVDEKNRRTLTKDEVKNFVASFKGDILDTVEDQDADSLSESQKMRKHELLWKAVEDNDVDRVESYLSQHEEFANAEIEQQDLYDGQGGSLVHKAASLGYVEIMMVLIERTGAKPDCVNQQLATPLHLACKSNREDVVKFLIGCGVDANVQDEHGQTPLLISCIHGYLNLVNFLIESSISGHLQEPLEVDLVDHRGLTPLNCAAIKGELNMVKSIVSRGGANVDGSSPRGCTPLIYAARGGYSEVVSFLLSKNASPMKQDNAGGTVLHHAIEKGHLEVLEAFLQHGIDVYSAIEISDNAGRTPLFEAVDNHIDPKIISILVKKKSQGGFGAKVNVVNYNGQTPLYAVAREGDLESLKVLLEAGAQPDLNSGEMVKADEEVSEDVESVEEKYFLEAFKATMTPLHVAVVLGYDEIALQLVDSGANVNLQTKTKGYTALHLAVLANKPEIIIELLTKTKADHCMTDYTGTNLMQMVQQFLPGYVDSFAVLLETLANNQRAQTEETIDANMEPTVVTHYYNPDDERAIQGAKPDEINDLYMKTLQGEAALQMQIDQAANGNDNEGRADASKKKLAEIDESEIEIDVEGNQQVDQEISKVFGRKVALALIAVNWKYKEMALKMVHKQTEKALQRNYYKIQQYTDLSDTIRAATLCVSLTCKDKVIKVLNATIQLFNLLVTSSKIEQEEPIDKLQQTIVEKNIIFKFLQKSEESNTRVTNKIHESLLDLSYHPKIGEQLVSAFILKRIQSHNKAQEIKMQSTDQSIDVGIGSHRGLLAQLALLYKFVNSFGVFQSSNLSPLNSEDLLNSIKPALSHQNQDVRNASAKILLDVHRLSGQVRPEEHLDGLNDKTKATLIAKLKQVVVEKDFSESKVTNDKQAMAAEAQFQSTLTESALQQATNKQIDFQKNKQLIEEKGQSKEWTEREIALQLMEETFRYGNKNDIMSDESFLTSCTILLKTCLEENNLSIYLIAMQVASVFFKRALGHEIVIGSLQSLVKAIALRTTDTNTRARKKSVDLINQIWDSKISLSKMIGDQNDAGLNSGGLDTEKVESVSQLIASVLCDPQLQEKAIVGRLGLFIKKAMMIESGEELTTKPHQLILGKNYEQLIEFSCQWCSHKNIKVRQSSLKLIVELCRMNHIDPKGAPFKQRIINYILGLRPSLRDPLVNKINEVCEQEDKDSNKNDGETPKPFINVNEMELNLATKHRAASMDLRRGKTQTAQNLPNIAQANKKNDSSALPGLVNQNSVQTNQGGGSMPTIVLPHSEPLTEEQIQDAQPFIELFNQEIMTCFYSQTWSTRQAAIQKIDEQLQNLDLNRRDAMSGEINRKGLPAEVTFKTFINFCDEALKDPVLKNYLLLLDLIRKALSIYFRYLRPDEIKRSLMSLVLNILVKTSDLKAKVREASINFCLYLSHQSPVGPEAMVREVLTELDHVNSINSSQSKQQQYGNSHLIASCLKLLNQFQTQSKLIIPNDKNTEPLYKQFIKSINSALKHQNPQVRKEGENLFKVLYTDFGPSLEKELVDQKPALVTKLIAEAKLVREQEVGSAQQQASQEEKKQQNQEQHNIQRAKTQVRDDFLNRDSIKQLLKGHENLLQQLKLPNPKKRLQAIVEIKKVVQREITKANAKTAKELFDPLTLLMRQLLKDDNTDIYLESLNLLKFIVGSLAPFLTTLDLHLMLGSFISVIVQNTIGGNMRITVASDKVIIYFAKHNNIGSLTVAKEVIKNIEKINKGLNVPNNQERDEQRQTLARFYSILQMLLMQFSIVLCYQPDFQQKCIEQVADTLNQQADEQTLKGICTQIIVGLHQVDKSLLEVQVSKLDFTRKTPVRKIMIELENYNQKNSKSHLMHQNPHTFVASGSGDRDKSPEQSMRDTQQSFTSRNSMYSPKSMAKELQSPALGNSQYDGWSKKGRGIDQQRSSVAMVDGVQRSEKQQQRRMISLDGRQSINSGISGGMNDTGLSWKARQQNNSKGSGFILPDIPSARGGHPRIMQQQVNSTGSAGYKQDAQYTPQRSQRTIETPISSNKQGQISRPPLYVPQKRDAVNSRGQQIMSSSIASGFGNNNVRQSQEMSSNGFQQQQNSNFQTGMSFASSTQIDNTNTGYMMQRRNSRQGSMGRSQFQQNSGANLGTSKSKTSNVPPPAAATFAVASTAAYDRPVKKDVQASPGKIQLKPSSNLQFNK